MKIEIARDDLLRLRRLIEEKHQQILNYPVWKGGPEFQGTRDVLSKDLALLRKFYGRLTLAIRSVYGHDCHPRSFEENMSNLLSVLSRFCTHKQNKNLEA